MGILLWWLIDSLPPPKSLILKITVEWNFYSLTVSYWEFNPSFSCGGDWPLSSPSMWVTAFLRVWQHFTSHVAVSLHFPWPSLYLWFPGGPASFLPVLKWSHGYTTALRTDLLRYTPDCLSGIIFAGPDFSQAQSWCRDTEASIHTSLWKELAIGEPVISKSQASWFAPAWIPPTFFLCWCMCVFV